MENPVLVAKRPKARMQVASSSVSSSVVVPEGKNEKVTEIRILPSPHHSPCANLLEVKSAHEALFRKQTPSLIVPVKVKSKAEEEQIAEQEALHAIFLPENKYNSTYTTLKSLELCDGRYADSILQEKFRKEVRFSCRFVFSLSSSLV